MASDRVVVGDCAARRDNRVKGGTLDGLPFLDEPTVTAERMERKIGRRSIRVDMGEATSDLAHPFRRIPDRRFRRGLDLVMERFETFPGDRGLEGIVDDRALDRALARVGHSDECSTPTSGSSVAVRLLGGGDLRRPSMVGTAFEGAAHPRLDRMVG